MDVLHLIKNGTTGGASLLVLDPNGSETIDGLSTLTMYSGEVDREPVDGVQSGRERTIRNG